MVALNAETENDDDSERWKEKWWWSLWTPKLRSDDDFERQNWEWWWLWTPSYKEMVALNSKTEENDSKRHNQEAMMALNIENKKQW